MPTAMITIIMRIAILMVEIVVVVVRNTAANASVKIQVILIQVIVQAFPTLLIAESLKYFLCYSECKTVDGDTCKFPFEYKGKTYNNCTKTDSSNFWCATYTLEGEYVPGLFGECADNCTKECGL